MSDGAFGAASGLKNLWDETIRLLTPRRSSCWDTDGCLVRNMMRGLSEYGIRSRRSGDGGVMSSSRLRGACL
jgi:hypothetical protein